MISGEMPKATASATPRLSVEPAEIVIGPDAGAARASWLLTNLATEQVEILETWLPHGQFFGARQALDPALPLRAGENVIIERGVRYGGEPGAVVENLFLNLRVRYRGEVWRVLSRMRLEIEGGGALQLIVNSVTTHPVGFAKAETKA